MRIFLFLASNAAILVVISVVFQVFGLEGILQENGVDLNLQALLLMSAIIGFGGSELAGRDKMIAALRRLQQASGEQESLPDQLAAFGIAGGVGHGLKRLFLSHPPLAERIAALEAGR